MECLQLTASLAREICVYYQFMFDVYGQNYHENN
jgi:hypothetical protein